MRSIVPRDTRPVWGQVLGLTMAQGIAFGVTLNAFGVLSLPLMAFFQCGHAQAGEVITAFLMAMTLAMPVAGYLVDRVAPRLIMAVGAALVGMSYGIAAYVTRLEVFVVLMGVAGVGIGLSTYMPIVTLISRWMPAERQGLAYGVMAAGVSAGGIVSPLVLAPLVARLPWTLILQGMGGLVLLVCLPLLLWAARPPSVGTGVNAAQSYLPAPVESGIRASLRQGPFWLWVAMLLLITLSSMSVLMALVPCLVAAGHSPQEAAGFHGATAAATLVGSLAFGALSNRWGAENTLLLGTALAAGGILCLLGAGHPVLGGLFALLFVLLWGSTFNLVNQLSPVLLGELLGQQHFGSLLGIGNLVSGIGFSLGPMMFGHLVDATYSYLLPLLLCAGLMVAALPVIAWLRNRVVPCPSIAP